MKKTRNPLFENVNSFFSFEDKNLKRIAPIENEVLSKIANISLEENGINGELYCCVSEDLEHYIEGDLLCEIWQCEDFFIVWENDKLKLQVNRDSLLNKMIDVCMGYQFKDLSPFTKRNQSFTYDEFLAKVNKIKTGIALAEKQDTKMIPTMDKELNDTLFTNYMGYCNMFHKVPFSKFCTILLEKCNLALKIKKELFEIPSITIDLDLVEKHLNLESLYLYIAFTFMREIEAIPNEFAEWKLEYLKKIYDYAKKNSKSDFQNVYAPESRKENGKIKMNNITFFMKKFESLFNYKDIREALKIIAQKEKENSPIKEPKVPKKIDKMPISKIAGIEEIFTIQLILNGNQTIQEQVKDFDLFSENHTFLNLIKDDYLYSLLVKIPFLKNITLEDMKLNLNLNKTGNLNITIDYVSLLETVLTHFDTTTNFDSCKSVEEIEETFINVLSDYGEVLSSILDGNIQNEEVFKNYKKYAEEVDNVPYELYLTRKIDSLLELLDCLPLLKTITNINIDYEKVNGSLDKDQYYFNTAINLFVKLYNQVMNKEKVNKEEYLFLARYVEVLKDISQKGYQVKAKNITCRDLVEKYTNFITECSFYDLDNTNLYNAIRNTEARKTLLCNWEMIPKGEEESFRYPSLQEKSAKKQGQSYSYKYSKVLERKYFLDHTDYECLILGTDTFAGYIGYKYQNGIIIFEKYFKDQEQKKPDLENATYVMNQANFIIHSTKSKTELMKYMKEGHKDVQRPTHTSKWKEKIMDIINNWGYSPATLKNIDALIEASKKNRKDGRVLEWKK